MADADLGVVPKRADSFGDEAYSTKIMEFMAVGVPVVVSSTKVDRYYFNDSIVRFFPSGDADALARQMLSLLVNAEVRQEMVHRASEYAATNCWESRKGDYLNLVDYLCDTDVEPTITSARPEGGLGIGGKKVRALIEESLHGVQKWVEDRDYKGYDPGDGLTSYLRPIDLRQHFCRARPAAVDLESAGQRSSAGGVVPIESTKGRGFMAWGYLLFTQGFRRQGLTARKLLACLDWLDQTTKPGTRATAGEITSISRLGAGACWRTPPRSSGLG